MKRKGFSLTELLIVIAIIGLLVSIVVPATARYAAVARRVVCASNLSHLMKLIVATQSSRRQSGLAQFAEPLFAKKEFWPGQLAAEIMHGKHESNPLFLCPDGISAFGNGAPPLLYRSGIDPNKFIPFDATEFLCASRRGVSASGESYTEYVIEENPGVQSKWDHSPCCGQPSWSTNDGIWRIYDRAEDGMRTVELIYYECYWPNELWVNGEFHWKNLASHVNEVLKFRDVITNYGYNVMASEAPTVSPDTIVLMDFNYLYVDAQAEDITLDLNDLDTARHLGKINVLYASGAVKAIGPASIYPELNPGPWTPEAD
ncbi:hypothetical protein LCGC14_0303670 [marine sediment metagenome]|uniref:Type II secretion system protein GspG C-terminal domain-containing protein n=1 Tax=marine sediment metagenome TaxID=412755 RepID=A0A0F9U6K8_9ZZZZ|nr:type II secretion system protein [Phycisphaerae bacterium]HDZ44293.1 type II secretion system protein [Phycisphaerae bacterium]